MREVDENNKDVKKPSQNDQNTNKSMNQEKPDLMKVHKSTDFDLKK